MKRVRESLASRWIALVLFTTFTGACASWQPVEGSGVPDRVRVFTTTREPIELTETRVHGDSILVGLDPQANETRIIPTDSILRLETKQVSEFTTAVLVAGIVLGGFLLFYLADDEPFLGY